jgi:hypothetical protein
MFLKVVKPKKVEHAKAKFWSLNPEMRLMDFEA